jgi:hypothetical protein
VRNCLLEAGFTGVRVGVNKDFSMVTFWLNHDEHPSLLSEFQAQMAILNALNSAGISVCWKEGMGWLTGFEPATARSTIWGSNHAELQPPPGCETSQAVRKRQRETCRAARVHRSRVA